ncbi:DHA2 family efflux MFS transporter permease subunit [Terriglobus sp. TAA 43]|uniref:DHA2 family efflux MFS transporter permease subunit n=1 Tax=Terriglobus sp. TAA 43 TaxID=278961 RepID=UPI000648B507|nr:DHA2 family efflux MFS transporter permease subunit [Terriglobus sp. TAA 43]
MQPLSSVVTERADTALIWKVGAVAVMGSFLSQMDATVVNVSLPTLVRDLHSNLSVMQWVTSGYLLALAFMLPLNGWLVDRIGARRLYMICLSTFTVSSALCAAASSAEMLVAFRVLQGLSGGLLAPMAQLMMARVAGKNMARVMGYATLPILLGPLVGPVIAGAILQHASWHWLFLVNVPVGVVAVLCAMFLLPNDEAERNPRSLDLLGLAILSPSMVLFLYGADHVRERMGLALLFVATLCFVLFVRRARLRGDDALVDLKLFHGTFRVAAMTQFLSNGAVYSFQLLLPYLLVRQMGLSPAKVGWLLVPLGLGMLLVYPSNGWLQERFGIRRLAVVGASIVALTTIPFVLMPMRGLSIPVLVVALFLRGMGQGAIGLPSITAAYLAVPRRELPMATTSMNIVQRLGGPTLTTLCATLLAWGMEQGTQPVAFAWVFGFLCLINLAVVAATLRLPLRASQADA